MAIDFMVMPLSRYLTGDFVTPQMRLCWDNDLPYRIVGPDGVREFPRDVPYGGPDAAATRPQCRALLAEDLRQLPPEVTAQLWDEASDAEPCFHRVEVRAYGVLLDHAAPAAKRGLLGLFRGKPAAPLHIACSLFLPCDYPQPVMMQAPFVERLTGSAPRALDELGDARIPPEAAAAVEVLRAALADAVRLRLPMIVDT
jgi:hypothetical protein